MVKRKISLEKYYLFLILFLSLIKSDFLWAGSPFLTDDPETVDYKHHEVYLFSTEDKTSDSNTIQGPAVEYNYGVLPDLQ